MSDRFAESPFAVCTTLLIWTKARKGNRSIVHMNSLKNFAPGRTDIEVHSNKSTKVLDSQGSNNNLLKWFKKEEIFFFLSRFLTLCSTLFRSDAHISTIIAWSRIVACDLSTDCSKQLQEEQQH